MVVSTAINENNPELVEARRRGLRILPRAAALAAVMAGRRGVAVAGTHGKTTTTSMLARALQHCGEDPSFAIGADLNEPGSNAHDGGGDLFIAEADESDESFLLLSPYAAIVTNVEADHLNHYASLDDIHQRLRAICRVASSRPAFWSCAPTTPARDSWQRSRDRPGSTSARTANRPTPTFASLSSTLVGTGSTFRLTSAGRPLGQVRLRVPGQHNAMNAAGAATVGLGLGLSCSPNSRTG